MLPNYHLQKHLLHTTFSGSWGKIPYRRTATRLASMHCLLTCCQHMNDRTFVQIQYNHFCITQQSHSSSLVAVLPDLQDYSSHASMQNRESLINIQKTSYRKGENCRYMQYMQLRYPYFPMVLPAPINEFFQGKWAHYETTITLSLPCHSDNLDFNIQLKGLSRSFLYSWKVLHN